MKTRLYQLKFDRQKALRYLYKADQLMKLYMPDEIELRHQYQDINAELNIQNKELIFAHQILFKKVNFQGQQSLYFRYRLAKVNFYMEDYVATEEVFLNILEGIQNGEIFENPIKSAEFLNLLIYFLVKQDKLEIVRSYSTQLQDLLKTDYKQIVNFINPLHLYAILEYLRIEKAFEVDQEILDLLKANNKTTLDDYLQSWGKDLNFIQTYDYSDEKTVQTSVGLFEFMQIFKDPLIYERYFQIQNAEFYKAVFNNLIILFRTSPLDRLSFLINSLTAA